MLDSNLENKILYFYRGMDIKDLRSCSEEEVFEINEKGYDVFWCLQEFKDGRRVKDNLKKINYVVADFDNTTVEAFRRVTKASPKPTMLITTRSGVHAYWRVTQVPEDVGAEAYKSFVEERIIAHGADGNAKDVCRILRMPNSRYWQDSKGNRYEDKEIRCEVVYDNGPTWEWEQLQRLFKKTYSRASEKNPNTGFRDLPKDESGFWAKANSIPVIQGLQSLSGKPCVRGENYTFRKEGKITRIIINGKDSNAWIDPNGRIGSLHTNGSIPIAGTLVNWLMLPEYGNDLKKIAEVFKNEFCIN